jgi:hypothetical protein
VLVLPAARAVFAVDNTRLFRVEREPDLFPPRGDLRKHTVALIDSYLERSTTGRRYAQLDI